MSIARTALLLFCVWAGQAVGCPEVRLDKTILKDVPVLDQDGSGICWAYTAATLIDAYRFSHGDKRTDVITSPLALAARANVAESQRELLSSSMPGPADNISTDKSGDWKKNAFEQMSKASLVSAPKEVRVSKNGAGWAQDALDQARQDKYVCSHSAVSKKYLSTDIADARFQDSEYVFDESEFTCPHLMTRILSTMGLPLMKVTHDVQHLALANIKDNIQASCADPNRAPIDIPQETSETAASLRAKQPAQSIADRLAELLAQKDAQPIGMNYCGDALTDDSVRTVDSNNMIDSSCNSRHWSSVVGSRTGADGKCEFLVRNSLGASCTGYPPGRCVRGQIWMSAESLNGNAQALTWL